MSWNRDYINRIWAAIIETIADLSKKLITFILIVSVEEMGIGLSARRHHPRQQETSSCLVRWSGTDYTKRSKLNLVSPAVGEQVFGVLSREDILKMLGTTPPLVENLCDVRRQVQPNGIDLTLKELALFSSPGSLPPANESRVLAGTSPLVFDDLDRIDLLPGCYLVTYNEVVNLPRNMMALAMPRSSLLRCGVSIHNAVWDAGYSGRSQSLMVVYNSQGFRIHRNARIVQMVFFLLSSEAAQGYEGRFQGENV